MAPAGDKGLAELQAAVAQAPEEELPAAAKEALALLGREIAHVEARLVGIDAKLLKQHRADPLSRRLSAVPGIGPIGALNLALRVDASQFRSGRHFAPPPSRRLVLRQRSTGGKQRLGKISRRR